MAAAVGTGTDEEAVFPRERPTGPPRDARAVGLLLSRLWVAGVCVCTMHVCSVVPGSAGVTLRVTASAREKTRETSLNDRGKSAFYFLTTGFIPFHRMFSRYKMLTHDYTGLALHHFDF